MRPVACLLVYVAGLEVSNADQVFDLLVCICHIYECVISLVMFVKGMRCVLFVMVHPSL